MRRKLQELRLLLMMEKQKAAVLGVLALVLALTGGRQFFSGRVAGGGSEPEDDGSPTSVLAGAELASALEPEGEVVRAPVWDLHQRDLFSFDPEFFPEPEQPAEEPKAGGEPAKSAGEADEGGKDSEAAQRSELARRVLAESERFRLKSTLLGRTPMAVIQDAKGSGRSEVVRPGERIGGFELVGVHAHGVVLEKDGVRVELRRTLPE